MAVGVGDPNMQIEVRKGQGCGVWDGVGLGAPQLGSLGMRMPSVALNLSICEMWP